MKHAVGNVSDIMARIIDFIKIGSGIYNLLEKIHEYLCGLVVRAPVYRSKARIQFPALRSSGSGSGSTRPREYNSGAT
jgi:hypothetical protein